MKEDFNLLQKITHFFNAFFNSILYNYYVSQQQQKTLI